jgi:multicomponent Na+:H+ antiporter subunit E
MLGLHILLAVGLAAFIDALSPLGVLGAFIASYLALRLGADLLGLRRYVRRLELGARFVAWFTSEVLKASIDVARIVLARRVRPQPAIIRLKLQRPDDQIATLLGCLLTLTPGTLALDYAPESGLMYIHAIDATHIDDIESSVREIESRLLEWLDAGTATPAPTGKEAA